MILQIDLSWLLDIAQQEIPGDPEISDWGALEAARARHAFRVMDIPVYDQPHHRAAALLEQFVRVPALEHSNELYGVVVAAAYLHACGQPVSATSDEIIDLVEQVAESLIDVRQVAAVLKEWSD
ncbi:MULTISPECIES: fic family toxin-antitoxin system, toxin component [unclassified Streptomyces]|uniref:fic family toxin-antitoxin system, toxin component n=1 Tax=unclassified Streptomyces TaxID=2593676 RepID=UPI0033D90A2C